MEAAVLVALVAGADLLRSTFVGRWRAAAIAAWLVAGLVVAGSTGSVGGWDAAAIAVGAAGWLWLRERRGAAIAMSYLVIAVTALVLGGSGGGRTAALVAAIGVAALLARTANDVCRDVLERAREMPRSGSDVHASGSADGDAAPQPAAHPLRGGRIIGPLERWLIAALALVGAQAVIVGLMAAKGIGRFPEISGDRARGSAAEEFLVGSLVSWAMAGAGAALVAALR